MAEVVRLDDRRPHVTITTHANRVHVVPVSIFEGIAKGITTVDSLHGRDAILRVIIAEWMGHIGVAGAEALREIEE